MGRGLLVLRGHHGKSLLQILYVFSLTVFYYCWIMDILNKCINFCALTTIEGMNEHESMTEDEKDRQRCDHVTVVRSALGSEKKAILLLHASAHCAADISSSRYYLSSPRFMIKTQIIQIGHCHQCNNKLKTQQCP